MSFDIYIGVMLSIVIIGVWGYIGTLTSALYSTTLTNHHQMRMFYTIAVFNIIQAVLGIYYIITGDGEWQQARWVAFSLIDVAYLGFVMGTFKKRWFELTVRTIFWILVLVSTVMFSVWLNVTMCAILAWLAYVNKEPIVKKYFPIIFITYSLTTVVPYLTGFTTNASLFMGVIYTCMFAYGAKKLYNKEKVNDAIDSQLREEIRWELRDEGNRKSKEV